MKPWPFNTKVVLLRFDELLSKSQCIEHTQYCTIYVYTDSCESLVPKYKTRRLLNKKITS